MADARIKLVLELSEEEASIVMAAVENIGWSTDDPGSAAARRVFNALADAGVCCDHIELEAGSEDPSEDLQ